MNTNISILSAIPAELQGFPEEDWESQKKHFYSYCQKRN